MNAEFFLPWPDKRLSPNARVHWASLARAKKAAKRTAYYTTIEAGIGRIEADSIAIRYSFFPPDRRARDADNMLSACKAYQDGIAAAIGVDDSKFQITIAPRGPVERTGMVKVELEWSDEKQ